MSACSCSHRIIWHSYRGCPLLFGSELLQWELLNSILLNLILWTEQLQSKIKLLSFTKLLLNNQTGDSELLCITYIQYPDLSFSSKAMLNKLEGLFYSIIFSAEVYHRSTLDVFTSASVSAVRAQEQQRCPPHLALCHYFLCAFP